MQWSLFLLILLGQCSVFTSHLYKFHFIKENKSWDEAQTYCREKHTDLATVYDMTDMERLRHSTKKQEAVWIGLRSHPGTNRTWHWSLPGVEFNDRETKWDSGEPNDKDGKAENCVRMDKPGWKLKDVPCKEPSYFICYNETQEPNKKSHLIKTTLSWPEAQNYCREHHTDLVSGLNQLNDPDLKEQIQSQDMLWIGLFRDTWRWSDGSHSSFRNWDLKLFKDDNSKKCAMTMLNGTGKWGSDYCNTTKPFFCYEDRFVLINEHKTWEEALYYCRDNYNDLASITNLKEQRWIQQKAKNASTPFVWLGLRYTCTLDFWFWVSDEVVGYENWASGGRNDECDMSGGMERGGEHKWSSQPDNNTYNFICSTF